MLRQKIIKHTKKKKKNISIQMVMILRKNPTI